MKTILFADDNPANRELVRDFLEAAGFQVLEACDGHDALEQLRAHRPDVVLLDVQMPKLDGLQVLAEIRQDPALARLPVIALTAYAMRGDHERMLASGFDAYLTKPIDFATLVAEVRAQIAKQN